MGSSLDRRGNRAYVESLEYQRETINVSDEIEDPTGIKIKSTLKISHFALWNGQLQVINSIKAEC